MSPITCPQCGLAINHNEQASTCPHCGAALPISTINSTIPPPPVVAHTMVASLPYGELQHAVTYLGMARTLQGIGLGVIFFGLCISCIMGFFL